MRDTRFWDASFSMTRSDAAAARRGDFALSRALVLKSHKPSISIITAVHLGQRKRQWAALDCEARGVLQRRHAIARRPSFRD